MQKISLAGQWALQLDGQKLGPSANYPEVIELPGSTSAAGLGPINETVDLGNLSEPYRFEGHAYYKKSIHVPQELVDKNCLLYMERTRKTTLWIEGDLVGDYESLNGPHVYDLTGKIKAGDNEIIVRVDNTDYKTKGGHMTSPDTQTNWNGITGRIELQFQEKLHIQKLRTFSRVTEGAVGIELNLSDHLSGSIKIQFQDLSDGKKVMEYEEEIEGQQISMDVKLNQSLKLWSDVSPNLYEMTLQILEGDKVIDACEQIYGHRDFRASGDKFTINGHRTFLRGKHDGLLFPMTGYAPTDVDTWVDVLTTMKTYGINHYRFHTCCPPEAAFAAADRVGIFMEPELPFWGTITDESYEDHKAEEQAYLIEEGYRMLDAFGNHPSFVMMSLGNELWGSQERLNEILGAYKTYDPRHMYTQGCNNFQFTPSILSNDDFFCGVRFDRERLIRGSYAMCDAPQGHVQVSKPSTRHDYDDFILPSQVEGGSENEASTIEIQYGTGVKEVAATAMETIVPKVPVVSHEIGQYATFPDFREIPKYRGVLKADNFLVFKEDMAKHHLDLLALDYFENSGRLAVDCYKEELEAAFRSKNMAGFQILDLQDFSGQGMAFVGILDPFLDNKGLISAREWRNYCDDAVLLGRFDDYNLVSGSPLMMDIEMAYYRYEKPGDDAIEWQLLEDETLIDKGHFEVTFDEMKNYYSLGQLTLNLPDRKDMSKLTFQMKMVQQDLEKSYDFYLYPKTREVEVSEDSIIIADKLTQAMREGILRGDKVVLFLDHEEIVHGHEATYATDFWNFPMFKSISEWMKKPIPVGTMGLLIEDHHPALAQFLTKKHTDKQWWSILSGGTLLGLDTLNEATQPIVRMMDNFGRNQQMALVIEVALGAGSLMIVGNTKERLLATVEGQQFYKSLISYWVSEEVKPVMQWDIDQLSQVVYCH